MNVDPDSSSEINPYAPTMAVAQNEWQPRRSELSRKIIVLNVILGVAGAGALFGFLLVLIVFFTIAASVSAAEVNGIGSVLIPGLFVGPMVGFVIGGLSALFVAPLFMWLFGNVISPDQRWTRRQINSLARLSGAFCGWLCFAALSGFDLWGMFLGLLPGAFALFVTPLLIRVMLRKAGSSDVAA